MLLVVEDSSVLLQTKCTSGACVCGLDSIAILSLPTVHAAACDIVRSCVLYM